MLYKHVCELLSFKDIFSSKKKRWMSWSGFKLVRIGLFKVGGYGSTPQTKEEAKNPTFICTKKSIKVLKGGSSWVPQRILESLAYRSHLIEFKNHWLRFDDEEGKRIRCPDYYLFDDPDNPDELRKKYVIYPKMEMNYNGKPMDYESKEALEYRARLDNYLDMMRVRTNLMAKARRHDKKAVAAIDHAEETGNYLGVNPADAFKVKNVSTRRKYLSKYSVEEIVESMKYEVCDKADLNGSSYELIKFPVEDPTSRFSMCYYLKMINVSTDETHLEGVGPYTPGKGNQGIEEETVKAALMWRDQERLKGLEVDGETVYHDYNAPVAIT